jgi:hypothetical protein
MDFLYQNKRQDELSFESRDSVDSVPDQIPLEGEAADLNKKFQIRWDKLAEGNDISNKALVQDILDILKDGTGAKKNRSAKPK